MSAIFTGAGDDDDASSVTASIFDPPKPEPTVTGPKLTPLQRPFQPGSTPEHLSSRFMVWKSSCSLCPVYFFSLATSR